MPPVSEYIGEEDTLVVTRLDRLARATLHFCRIAEELKRKKVDLHVLDQNINNGNATGRLLFNMVGQPLSLKQKFELSSKMDGINKANEKTCSSMRSRNYQTSKLKVIKGNSVAARLGSIADLTA